jgi:hypothetical protein
VAGGGQDVVYSHLRQLLPLRPQPFITGQAVFVYSNISYLGGEWVGVTGSLIDLSGASPTGGARFVLLYADDDGLIEIATGNIENPLLLKLADIPQPLPGTIPIAAVRLYPGQIRINDAPNMRDIVDLRWNAFDTRAMVTGAPVGGGDVYGDASATDEHLAVFDVDGYHIKDGGVVPVGGGGIINLATVTNIDATTVAITSLYTVPAGKSLIVDHTVVRVTSMVFGSKTQNAIVSFGGNSPTWDDYWPSVEGNFSAVAQAIAFRRTENDQMPVYQTADVLKISIETGSDATTEVWAIDVFGYLI